jgi:hypothetical protein
VIATLTAVVLALPDAWLAQHADMAAAADLNFHRDHCVRMTRPTEDLVYDADWTAITFAATDELLETLARGLWQGSRSIRAGSANGQFTKYRLDSERFFLLPNGDR